MLMLLLQMGVRDTVNLVKQQCTSITMLSECDEGLGFDVKQWY